MTSVEPVDLPVADASPLNRPENFFNRELSWIDFNERVLLEACNDRHPLLERVKFLAISGSNLDEYFMVRLSGLREALEAGVTSLTPDGRTPTDELAAVREAIRSTTRRQSEILHDVLLPALAQQGIKFVQYDELPAADRGPLDSYFDREVFPVCTPLAVDTTQAFPFISSLSLNLLAVLRDPEGVQRIARLKVPPFARLVRVGQAAGAAEIRLVWLEDFLRHHLAAFFHGYHVEAAYPFRVIRDADFEVREIEAGDLLERVQTGLKMRRFGGAVALEVDNQMPDDLCDLLTSNLEVSSEDVYRGAGPLGLSDLMELLDLDRPDLKDEPFVPGVPAAVAGAADIFASIQRRDILLHHPFDSFDVVIDLLNQAAADPNVLAIKQCPYRVGRNSPVTEALRRAVDSGKQVAILLELKARFDEENNIGWAQELERAGVHVMYGFDVLKVHSKALLIVRREPSGIRRYVHIGTGNYNRTTARLYTDFGVLTCREDIGDDVSHLFNSLTGYANGTDYRVLLVAPRDLRDGLSRRIEREIERHRRSGDGRLIFKMNALTDPDLTMQLYRASREGVRVDLLVRGICCLKPGVPGLSDHIRVISEVGRFLEHSRVYYFHNGGQEECLIGSADFMERNLDHRVEVLAPIFDGSIRARLKDILDGYLGDTFQAQELQPDGSYARRDPGDRPYDIQRRLLGEIEIPVAAHAPHPRVE